MKKKTREKKHISAITIILIILTIVLFLENAYSININDTLITLIFFFLAIISWRVDNLRKR